MVFCAGALGCAGALNISFPKSIWFLALCSHSGPKYLYLAMKTSYLHVYLVPTRLLIFRKYSHLHAYLVYTFIQYHGVDILDVIYWLEEAWSEVPQSALNRFCNKILLGRKTRTRRKSRPSWRKRPKTRNFRHECRI